MSKDWNAGRHALRAPVVRRVALCLVALALAGCAGGVPGSTGSSQCSTRPGDYACQVEQYMRL